MSISSSGLRNFYTDKQIRTLQERRRKDWFISINHGAKSSGKTILDNDMFLMELMRVRKTADRLGIANPQYILAGSTLGNIQDNVLTELTNKYGLEFKFDRYNNFRLFGVKIVQTFTSSVAGVGRIRGMTAFGAYINEATLAHPEVWNEIRDRCRGQDARIISDTNPDHPEHWLLKDFINNKKASGIMSTSFHLEDNTFLSERYIRNLKETTPPGMLYDRGIHGLWVSGQGVVYPDFDKNRHSVTREEVNLMEFERIFCGVDWGWEHYGSIVVIGVTWDNKYVVIEEHAYQRKKIADWIKIAHDIMREYGDYTPFYCDTARPDNITEFEDAGINAIGANKSVMPGVEFLATLYYNDQLFIVYKEAPRFRAEIYKYIWHPITKEPKKEFDDVQDSIRYGIYSDWQVNVKEFGSRASAVEQLENLRLLGLAAR